MVPIANEPPEFVVSHSASGVMVDGAPWSFSGDLVSRRSPDALSELDGNQLGKITVNSP